MRDLFANPPVEYRPMPFWFWNHKLDHDEIERQILEMHEQGLGGFFIHGRFGLETEYLSSEWMDMVEFAVQTAKTLGMIAWLYDENPFPSGVGGGIVMRDKAHWSKFLDLVSKEIGGEETIELDIPEGNLLAVYAVDLSNKNAYIDLMSLVAVEPNTLTPSPSPLEGRGEQRSNGRLRWKSPAGRWKVMAFVDRFAECPNFMYGSEPNYFEPKMMEEWFEITHEAYAWKVGEYFGRGIAGIFTDEPKLQCIHHMHDDPFTSAWFADLPEVFLAQNGYDLIPNLPALFTDFGPDPGKVRRDFWRTVGMEYQRRFFKPYHDWCKEHGIKMTGHLFLEEGLYANTMYQANFMQNMRWFDIPGTDQLGLSAESEYQIPVIPGSITRTQGQKIASSSAHIYAKDRCLSETFGCAGWELNMAHMKWIVDWQHTLGINLLCPHAFYYSLAGVRKTDAPPSQFYQATYWKYYRKFADYVGRLSMALSQGKHHAQVAVLYPIESFQSEWGVGTQGPIDKFIAESYDFYCLNLMRQHFDYDLVTEETIQTAGVSTGHLKIASEKYDLLILPPVTTMELSTLKKIRDFVRAGGKVLGTGLLPASDATPSSKGSPVSQEVIDIVNELFDQEPASLREDFLQTYHEERGPAFGTTSKGKVGFINCNRAHLLGGVLREAVESLINPEIRVTSSGQNAETINAVHRSTEDGEVFFFANNSEEVINAEISLAVEGVPEQCNLETGDIRPIPGEIRDGRLAINHRFDTYGSLLLVVSKQAAKPVETPVTETTLSDIELNGMWNFRTESPNVLPLKNWKLEIEPSKDSTTYIYEHAVHAHAAPNKAFIVLDDLKPGKHSMGTSIEIEVNGEMVKISDTLPWAVDINFPMVDISGRLKVGENKLTIRVVHGGWSGPPKLMTAPQFLLGEFSLERQGDDFALASPLAEISTGSWADQGYPFYSGTAVYSQKVTLPEEYIGKKLTIRADNPADMIEVWVNGRHAGTRPWPPFEVDISAYTTAGDNDIEIRVANSLENMLRQDPRPSGLLGTVWIDA